MLEIISLLCMLGALILLFVLSVIDLRTYLLPDKYVLPFLLLGLGFHFASGFATSSPADLAIGAVAGGGILYAIRTAAGALGYEDGLGLGDVKLMAAAGIWLGLYHVLIALTLGAIAGVLHGLGFVLYTWLKNRTWIDMRKLSLPAGPGFAMGIVIAAMIKFWNFAGMFPT